MDEHDRYGLHHVATSDISNPSTTANASDQLTPIIIIAAAVFWTKGGQNLSVSEAFTSLSIIALVSSPLVNLIAAYPTFVSGLACFSRIQTFLLRSDRKDYRSTTPSITTGLIEPNDIELQPLSDIPGPNPVIHIRDASFSLQTDTDPVLKNISLDIRRSSLMMVTGPVGSGKSALLKAILGEAQILSGSVLVYDGPVGYCDQAAWLRMGSVRDNILGPREFDESWYRQVIRACALDEDISRLENGDETPVGSAGMALSGGQKQRVVGVANLILNFSKLRS